MALLGDMTVRFGADTAGLTSGINTAKGAIASLASNPLGAVGLGLAAVGVAAVATGIAATKMAGDFQQGITTLETGAGEAHSNLKLVSDGILDLAVKTGSTTKQLTDGMFMIESAGYHGKEGLDVLKNAAEGAKVGNADLGTVADATTTIMKDFSSQNIDSAHAVNALVATVQNGKTHMEDLSHSLSMVLPTASAAKIGLQDVMGAMATMTAEGVPAANAATYLRQTIISLEAPGSKAAKTLKEIGLSTADVATEMQKSLPMALQDITDHLKKKFPEGSAAYVAAIKDIAGGSKTMQGMLDLTGTHLQEFKDNVGKVGSAMKQGGESIIGWNRVQDDFNHKVSVAREVFDTLMIKIGTGLLPVMGKLFDKISPLLTQFSDWVTKNDVINKVVGAGTVAFQALGTTFGIVGNFAQMMFKQFEPIISFFQKNKIASDALMMGLKGIGVIFLILAGIIGGAVVMAVVMIGSIILGLVLVVTAIGAAINGVIWVFTHWGEIGHWLQGVWNGVISWFKGVFGSIGAWFAGIWAGIQSGLQAAWGAIVKAVQSGGQLLLDAILAPFRAIGDAFVWLYHHDYYVQALVDNIVNFTKTGVAWLQNAWNVSVLWIVQQWNRLAGFASAIWGQISSAIMGPVTSTSNASKSTWSAAVGFISGQWNRLAGFAQQAWGAVGSVFSRIWGSYIAGPLGSLWNSISGWFNGLVGQASAWGRNLIQGFINGITSMLGSVGNAASNVANTVKSFLGIHSPAEKGPMSDADRWSPNLVKMIVSGLIAGTPQVASASQAVAQPLTMLAAPASGSVPSSGVRNNAGQQHIHIHIGDQEVGHAIVDSVGTIMMQKIRAQASVGRAP